MGYFDELKSDSRKIYVRGWAFDEDNLDQTVDIHVYIGGPAGSKASECHVIKANQRRTDVNDTFPGVGDYHGYNSWIRTNKTGKQPVYIYAINVGEGSGNTLLGTKTIKIKK